MESASNRNKQVIAGLAVLIIIVVIVAAVSLGKKEDTVDNSASTTTTSDTATAETSATTTSSDSAATFKDGTYTASGGYNSPGGAEEISITVTLKDGVITSTSAESEASDAEAREYQEDFIASYKDQVVGKKISELKLGRIAGSSLTPIGFNNAIDQIEDQAKA